MREDSNWRQGRRRSAALAQFACREFFSAAHDRNRGLPVAAFTLRVRAGMPRFSARLPTGLRKTYSRPAPKKQNLDALAIAERQNPENPRIRQSRLGEVDDDDGFKRSHDGTTRRAKRRKLSNASSESEDGGSDSEGHQWQLGKVDKDDDSDLDSDEAMNESDNERFADFAFRGSSSQHPNSKKSSGKSSQQPPNTAKYAQPNVDLSETGEGLNAKSNSDMDGDSDDFGDEAVDLATALDMNIEEEKLTTRRRKSRQETPDSPEKEMGDEVDSVRSSDEDGEASDLSFTGDEDEDDLNNAKLLEFVNTLDENDVLQKDKSKASRLSHIYDVPSRLGPRLSKKLTVDDLLPSITDPSLRQSLKILRTNEHEEAAPHREGIPGKLAPPLAKRQQDRLDRTAAYEKGRETLNRWIDTVKQNRRAEHVSFPLPENDAGAVLGTRQLLPTSTSKPITSLEGAINSIMQQSNLPLKSDGETQLQVTEDLRTRRLSVEEVQERRAQLRRQRDLMFREEKRARRIKKIKSKAYRRVHRKARDKEAQEERQTLADAGLLNSEDERERNERRRAEERMGARHRESKWAQGVKAIGRAAWDEEARSGVTDLARRDEELRQRISGQTVYDDYATSSSMDSESENDLSNPNSDGAAAHALNDKLDMLDHAKTSKPPLTGLASMKFMQRAEAARNAVNDAAVLQLRNGLAGKLDEEVVSLSDENSETGRQQFGRQSETRAPQSSRRIKVNDFEALSEKEDGRESHNGGAQAAAAVENQYPTKPDRNHPAQFSKISSYQSGTEQGSTINTGIGNPWLSSSSRRRDEKIHNENHSRGSMPKAIVLGKNKETSPLGSSTSVGKRTGLSSRRETSKLDDVRSVSDSDEAARSEGQLTRMEKLSRMAFAGDDVSRDFVEEKQDIAREEGDQVIDETLPGWGSWTGEGIGKRERKRQQGRFIKTIKGVDQEKRQDATLERVIINEKRVKKVSPMEYSRFLISGAKKLY